MAKKEKRNNSAVPRANAPDYHQILHQQQPAHNPYYPDPSATQLAQTSVPPPPYSPPKQVTITSAANSFPMSQLNDISYPRVNSGSTPIVVQAPGLPYDHRAERYRHKVRSFNAQTIIIGILSIMLSLWSYSLFNHRSCVDPFVVYKLNNDVEIKYSDIRQGHLQIAYNGAFLVLLCILKSVIGFGGKSHGCYLFIVGLYTLAVTIYVASLTYFVFYSPCPRNTFELARDAFKTIASKLSDSLPTPDKGYWGESNVIVNLKEDGNGFAIFVMDVLNLVFYLSVFISSTTLC